MRLAIFKEKTMKCPSGQNFSRKISRGAVAVVTLTFFTTLIATLPALAQTVKNLVNFHGRNGQDPSGAMVQATDGNFYGATAGGGAHGSGSVFQMTPSGQLSTIYSFCSQPGCTDGIAPYSGPVLGSDGNLYGVAALGGSSNGRFTEGSGIVYRLTVGGEFSLLYTFCSTMPCIDGQFPNGLVLGYDGNFYGTTSSGGRFSSGKIFSISSTGEYKVVYAFCSKANCTDGGIPQFPPIQGSDGNFYGVTLAGGTLGHGVAYKLTPPGTYTVLHNFCDGEGCNGSQPNQLVQDAKGNFFGTTVMGGSSATGNRKGFGTVFEITSTGRYIVLDNFDFIRGAPGAGFALANDGNLYGTSAGSNFGGTNGGTIFEVTPTGRLTELYTFDVCGVTGFSPSLWLVQGSNGAFYGSTIFGGGTGCEGEGSIYSLSTGLSPLVKTVPAGGAVGNSVLILGNHLSGTTSVSFNGVNASFTVESDTYIKATVPPGATSGTVSVVTPSRTLNSNPQFVVTK